MACRLLPHVLDFLTAHGAEAVDAGDACHTAWRITLYEVLPFRHFVWPTLSAYLVGPVFKMGNVRRTSPVCPFVEITPASSNELEVAAAILPLGKFTHDGLKEGIAEKLGCWE